MSLSLLFVGPPSHLENVFSFACQIKLICNQAVTLVHQIKLSYNSAVTLVCHFKSLLQQNRTKEITQSSNNTMKHSFYKSFVLLLLLVMRI